jgi:hypothetical protein
MQSKVEDITMHTLKIAAVTIAFGALLAAAPASAERNPGPLAQNGKCWTDSFNQGKDKFGYWGACPQTASAVVVTPRHRRHHSASR